jgi:hypothetical protein
MGQLVVMLSAGRPAAKAAVMSDQPRSALWYLAGTNTQTHRCAANSHNLSSVAVPLSAGLALGQWSPGSLHAWVSCWLLRAVDAGAAVTAAACIGALIQLTSACTIADVLLFTAAVLVTSLTVSLTRRAL